jgi:hypothetical protein
MDDMQRVARLALASLLEEDCPDPDVLADYMMGSLGSTEQLRVAAHVRDCLLCEWDIAVSQPPEPRPRTVLARLLPFTIAEGRRASASRATIRRYLAADLLVVVTIAAPDGDVYRLTGQISRGNNGLPGWAVTMRAGRHRYQQISDDLGFFTFLELPAGRYTLTLTHGAAQVQIRRLTLPPGDE